MTNLIPARQPNERGFTLLELLVVIIIVSLLFVYAAERLFRLQVEAERVAMEQVLGNLRSALAMEIAAHVARDRIPQLAELIGTNPMERLSQQPDNYLGVLAQPDPATVPGGQWYFDPTEAALVYRASNTEYLASSLGPPAHIKFKILAVYADTDRNRRPEAKPGAIAGLKLVTVMPYRWRTTPDEATASEVANYGTQDRGMRK